MDEIAVSVVVPTHNSLTYIREAMDSILSQTLDNLEVICVDSSSDETKSVLREYQNRNGRIRIIDDPNSSYGHKMNRGMKEARGRYLGILESDDMMKNEMLERLYKMARLHRVDYIKSSYTNFFSTGIDQYEIDQRRYCGDTMVNRVILPKEEPVSRRYSLNNIWTGLYDLGFLRKHNILFNESPGASYQDTGFSVLCAIYAQRIFYLPDCLYLYRRDNRESSVKNQEKYRCIYDEIQWLKNEIDRRDLHSADVDLLLEYVEKSVFLWNAVRLQGQYRRRFLSMIHGGAEWDICSKIKETEIQNEVTRNQFYAVLGALKSEHQTDLIGTGNKGKAVCELEKYIGHQCMKNVYDNDARKVGTIFYGHIIQKPDEIKYQTDGYRLIIANANHYKDMKEQMLRYGIEASQIVDASYFPEEAELLMCLMSLAEEEQS